MGHWLHWHTFTFHAEWELHTAQCRNSSNHQRNTFCHTDTDKLSENKQSNSSLKIRMMTMIEKHPRGIVLFREGYFSALYSLQYQPGHSKIK